MINHFSLDRLIRQCRAACLLVSLLLFANASQADQANIRFQQIVLEQGLSQETVLSITQDQQGFMWFATQEGLNRYDGYSFKVFSHRDSDPTSLSSDFILALAEDGQGNLWIGTDGGGLNLYHSGNQNFSHYRHQPNNDNSLSNDTVRVIFIDSQGLLWIGTDNGLNKFDPDTERFVRYQHQAIDNSSISGNRIRSIAEDAQGQLWIGTDGGGLNRLNPNSGKFTHFQHDPDNPTSLSSNRVRSMLFDSQHRLWIGTYGKGINLMDGNHNGFSHFVPDSKDPDSLANGWIRDIFEDQQGSIWFATDKGLDQWQNGKFGHHQNDPFNPFSLSGNKITALFQDRGKVFWVGTHNGLNKWNTSTTAFNHIRHQANQPHSLSNNGVNAFARNHDGQVWIGTYGGLNLWDPAQAKVTQLISKGDGPGTISDDRVMSLHAEQQQLWIGTRANGLDKLDIASGQIRNYRHQAEDNNSLSANGITYLEPASDGKIWIGTWGGGLNLFDPISEKFKRFHHNPKNPYSISSDKILSIHVADDGLVWLGTWGGGLNILDPLSGRATKYMKNKQAASSLNSNNIWAIHEDKQHNIWFATQGGGLNLLTAESRRSGKLQFEHFTMLDGLPSNVIYGIVEDEKGCLWLSTNRGLTKFDPQGGTFLNYDRSHGLQGNEFNAGAYFNSDNHQLYFGGTNGVTAFDPADIKPNPHQPPVVLTNFLKLNQEVSPKDSLNSDGMIQLHYRDYLVAFEFAGLDFASPPNNHYKYKLEGFDKQWIEAGPRRRATYTNLPDGHYTFKVKASNNDGVWNENGYEININVTPPPWRSWWAYLSYGLILVGIAALFIRANLRKLQQAAHYRRKLELEVRNRTQDLEDANAKLHEASVTDQLTGLHNRRYLANVIEKEIAQVERHLHSDETQSTDMVKDRLFFLMFDLDGFKPVNDTYGHSAGDQVIVKVGELLHQVCRQSDTLIRWGGDEFMVMGHADSVDEISTLAERLRHSIENHGFDIGIKQKLDLSCSIGFSFHPFSLVSPQLLSWEQAAGIADQALYLSKERGRNCWTGIQATNVKPPLPLFHWLGQDVHRVVKQGYVKLITHKEVSTGEELSQAQ